MTWIKNKCKEVSAFDEMCDGRRRCDLFSLRDKAKDLVYINNEDVEMYVVGLYNLMSVYIQQSTPPLNDHHFRPHIHYYATSLKQLNHHVHASLFPSH